MNLQSSFHVFLEFLTTWYAIGIIGGVIIAAAILYGLEFKRTLEPKVRNLKHACAHLEKTANEAEFAAQYEDIDANARRNPTISHAWSEFTETLIFPEFESDPEVVRNTEKAENFFNRASLLSGLNLRFYNTLPNLLTGSGILFTFVGLVAGILLASSGLAADNIADQRAALQELLGGAGLAFATSIIGLLTSLSFSGFEKRQIHRFDNQCARWTNALEARLTRITPEQIAQDELNQARQQTRTLEAFTDKLVFQIADAIEQQVTQPLAPMLERLIHTMEGMRDDRDSSNQAAMERLVGQFSETVKGAAGQEIQALGQTLEGLNERLSQHVDRLETRSKENEEASVRATRDLEETLSQGVSQIREALNSIGSTAEGLETVRTAVAELVDRGSQLVDKARESHEALSDVAGPLRETATQVTEAGSTVQAASEEAARAAQRIRDGVEDLRKAQDSIAATWSDHQQRFEGLDESLGDTFSQLEDGLARYSQSINEFVRSLDDHASQIVGQLSGAVTELREAIEELPQTEST